MERFQHTINKAVKLAGVGLHSGKLVKLVIKPAKANSGIRFVRADIDEKAVVPAFMNKVIDTTLATTIGEENAIVSTTEHLLAALTGLGIDNATIELDGAEVPIMDGSAGPFVHVLSKVKRRRQKSCRRMLKITKEVSFQEGDKLIRIVPFNGLKITCRIDFDHQLIQKQSYSVTLSPKKFADEIAGARTFGFAKDVELLQKNGFALGGSLDNAIVIDKSGIINEDGLRYDDEFVRHKVLDIIGDLTLLGCPVLGHVIAYKTGHGQHLKLLQELVHRRDAWEFVKLEKNNENKIFECVNTTTRAAGNLILPFLVPQQTGKLAGETCTA